MAQLIFRKKTRGIIYIYSICNTNMCNLQYKQTKMIGHVVKLVKIIYPYVHLLEWQLRHLPFHFKVGRFFFNWRTSFYVPAKIAPYSFSLRGAILWVFWFLS